LIKQIQALLIKDFRAEFRRPAALSGILLYIVSTVFITYQIFLQLEEASTWIALFWIILLFAATNASINSFRRESGRQYLYYYSTVNPRALLFSKIIFNVILIWLITVLNFTFCYLLLGKPDLRLFPFFISAVLGSSALSAILTLVSAIASRTSNNATLTAILAFPILLPILLLLIKSSRYYIMGFGLAETGTYLGLIGLLILLILLLGSLLFPYLWRS
jgi:heme exporter protein B